MKTCDIEVQRLKSIRHDAPVQGFSDANHARTSWAALATAEPAVHDLPDHSNRYQLG